MGSRPFGSSVAFTDNLRKSREKVCWAASYVVNITGTSSLVFATSHALSDDSWHRSRTAITGAAECRHLACTKVDKVHNLQYLPLIEPEECKRSISSKLVKL
jgi:hypothetical protein